MVLDNFISSLTLTIVTNHGFNEQIRLVQANLLLQYRLYFSILSALLGISLDDVFATTILGN